MLRYHKYKREVVHPECSIEQPICVNEEYNVLDSILNEVGLGLYFGIEVLDVHLAKHNWNRTLESE